MATQKSQKPIPDLEQQPTEIQKLIIENSPIESVIKLCETSKTFKKFCEDQNMWKKRLTDDFGVSKLDTYRKMYIKYYKNKKQLVAVKNFLKKWIAHYNLLDLISQNRIYDKFIELLGIKVSSPDLIDAYRNEFEDQGYVTPEDVEFENLWTLQFGVEDKAPIYYITEFISPKDYYKITEEYPKPFPELSNFNEEYKDDIKKMYTAWIVFDVNRNL